MDSGKDFPTQPSELSIRQKRIDELFADRRVYKEFGDTSRLASNVRSIYSAEFSNKSPKFRYIKKYWTAILNIDTMEFAEGEWNGSHARLSGETGAGERYLSFDCFELRGAPGVKVAKVYSLRGFGRAEFDDVKRKGFEVMDPDYRWVVTDPRHDKLLTTVPSTLSMRLSY